MIDSLARVVKSAPRRIVLRTRGRRRGPVTRLVSPSNIGALIKPFVFLDHAEVAPQPEPLFGIHPHSGIATLMVVLGGGLRYEDTTGRAGEVSIGGLAWMRAGNGAWHAGAPTPGDPLRAFQLWVALPASEENGPAESQYIAPSQVQEDGPVRAVLGRYGHASSAIRAPAGIHYFHVRLAHKEQWRYEPPAGHTVAWLAVDRGRLLSTEEIPEGALAVFEKSNGAVEVQAKGERRSCSAPRFRIRIDSCSGSIRCTRAPMRSRAVKPRSGGSPRDCTPKAVCDPDRAINHVTSRSSVMSVTSSVETSRSPRSLGVWALQVVVAAAFLAAGGAKLAGVPAMIQLFDQIGVGQWFRIVTGVVEIVGAFALLYPGVAAIGGLWLGSTMVGAVATHLFVLHSSPAAPVVLFALNALIVYLRRDQLVALRDQLKAFAPTGMIS